MSKDNEIKIEIDYNKLANAIVKAMEKKDESTKKRTKWRKTAIKWMNGIIYISLAIASFHMISDMWASKYDGSFYSLFICVTISIFFGGAAVLCFLCQQETFDDDYDLANNNFSANIALVALIVAIFALTNG